MKLKIFGGTEGATEYGIGAEIDPLDAISDGYRVWIDGDGWWRGDPLIGRCRWNAWWAKLELPRPEWAEVAAASLVRVRVNPDCKTGKHDACNGDAWDTIRDAVTECPCTCHPPKETPE
jgi:hypothetical protein